VKGLLEKPLYYSSKGTLATAKYWVIYFGDYSGKIMRKFPGEELAPIDATVNFNFNSSGYIEGRGYSAKGKIECEAKFAIKTADREEIISLDTIDAIYDFGKKVLLKDGTDAELLMDLEGTKIPIKKLMLREYKFVDLYGEKILKEDTTKAEVYLSAFAFSKTALDHAQKQSTPQK
jgi:hypothetical protein